MSTEIASGLVNVQWLEAQLPAPDLLVVDCRFQLSDPQWGHQQYCLGHIPGAVHLDLDRHLSGPVLAHGGRHPLPDVKALSQTFSRLGITRGKTWVIAYDDNLFAFAARLWWLLRFLGHDRIALLDGGWSHWQSLDFAVEHQAPPARPNGAFVPQVQTDWIVDIQQLKALMRSPNVTVIDSRDEDRYRGEREPIDPIAGHIPGAVNSPWRRVSDDQGFFHPLSHQQQLWRPYALDQPCIVYCGSGVTACVNLFSLYAIGLTQAKLFPGGWSDWCSYLSRDEQP